MSLRPWEMVAAALLIGVAIGWLLRFMVTPFPSTTGRMPGAIAGITVRHDTTATVLYRDRTVYREIPARMTRTRDTLVRYVDSLRHDTIIAQPFVMISDTIDNGDTISIRSAYPPPLQSLVIRRRPDTLRTVFHTITVESVRDRPWYETLGIGLAGGCIGYGVRAMTAPR